MKKTKTDYDTLKAYVTVNGKRFDWTILAADGQLMAAGEEFRLSQAFDAAFEAVTGIRLWMPFARDSITPANDRSRRFIYKNTEYKLTRSWP